MVVAAVFLLTLIFSLTASSQSLEFVGTGLWSGVQEVRPYGGYLYCLYPFGIEVLDISRLDRITVIDRFRTNPKEAANGFRQHIEIYKDILFLLDSYNELKVLKIGDNGEITSSITATLFNKIISFKLRDGKLFLIKYESEKRYMEMYFIHDNAALELKESFKIPDRFNDFCVSDNAAYFLENNSIEIYARDGNSKLESSSSISTDTNGECLLFRNQYLLVRYSWDLRIYELTAKDGLTFITSFKADSYIEDMMTANNYLYLATSGGGISTFDLSNPRSPKFVSRGSFVENSTALYVDDKMGYLISRFSGIYFVDMSDIINPKLRAKFQNGHILGNFILNGSYAYILSPKSGLLTVDLTNKEYPNVIDISPADTAYNDGFIAETDNNKYLLLRGNISGFGLYNLDDPGNPQFIETFQPDAKLIKAKIEGDLLISISKSSDDEKINIYNLSKAAGAKSLAHIETPGNINDFEIRNNILYIAAGDSGLAIFDLKEPEHPTLLSRTKYDRPIKSICLNGKYAYLSPGPSTAGCIMLHHFNTVMVDISNGKNPEIGNECKKVDFTMNYINSETKFINSRYALIPFATFNWIKMFYLQLIDFSAPETPCLISKIYFVAAIQDIEVDDEYIYLTASNWTSGNELLIYKFNESD